MVGFFCVFGPLRRGYIHVRLLRLLLLYYFFYCYCSDCPERTPASPSQGSWEESEAAREFGEIMEFV